MGRARLPQLARHLALVAVVLFLLAGCSLGRPLKTVGEDFAAWKARLFGNAATAPVEAPASGPIQLVPGQATRLRIGAQAPERDFPGGASRYRLVELPAHLEHAAVRVQVVAQDNPNGRGNAVFKPVLYVLGEDGKARAAVAVEPLHIDMRPFTRTRLLGCVTLDDVDRVAVATTPAVLGQSYRSETREAVKAKSQGGFHYATESVKASLPWVDTGLLILEVEAVDRAGAGC